MLTLEQVEAAAGSGAGPDLAALDALLRPLEAVLPDWPSVELDVASALRVSQGGRIVAPSGLEAGLVRLYGPGRRFLGVGELRADGLLGPRRLIAR
jgi:tRNA pseudouridine55 synthase